MALVHRLSPRRGQLADPTLTDAILDRVLHNSYRMELSGESLRKAKKPLRSSTDLA